MRIESALTQPKQPAAANRRIVAGSARQPDRLRPAFSGKAPTRLPESNFAVLVPGLFAPECSMQEVDGFLKNRLGLTSHPTRIRTNLTGRKFKQLAPLLKKRIDHYRAKATRKNMAALAPVLALPQDRQVDAIRQVFGLEDSAEGTQIAGIWRNVLISLYARKPDQPFIRKLFRRGGDQQLARSIASARAGLSEKLPARYSPLQREKITNRLIEQLAPRAIVIGHSMGGVAAIKTLQLGLPETHDHGNRDIAMVVCLSSPVNGTPVSIPWADKRWRLRQVVEKLIPAIPDFDPVSEAIGKIQRSPVPGDVTVFSIANAEDDTVPLWGTHLPNLPNIHHFEVEPKPFKPEKLAPGFIKPVLDTRPGKRFLEYFNRKTASRGFGNHAITLLYNDRHMEEIRVKLLAPDRMAAYLAPENNESFRHEVLGLLLKTIERDPARKSAYQALEPVLQKLSAKPLPFERDTAKLAARALALLKTP